MGKESLAQRFLDRNTLRLVAECIAVYGIAWAFLYGLQFQTGHIPEPDGYYHIKAAWLLRTEGVLQEFPWAAFSTWSESFVNKDLGFHALLLPFTLGDLTFGAKLAAVSFGAVIFASFYLILRLRQVSWPWLWTLLMTATGSYFLWRVNVPRPQLLSITLSLWAIFAIVEGRTKLLFALTWLYALSYTAPFVVVGYAVTYAVWHWFIHREWRWQLVVAAFAGLAAGWVLNPYFPDNLSATWVQTVDVLRSAWGDTGPNLRLATELLPMSTKTMLVEHVAIIIPAILAFFAMTRLRGKMSAELLTLITLSFGYFVMTCLSKRFVEYSVPLTLWTCSLILSGAVHELADAKNAAVMRLSRHKPLVAALAILVCMGLFARSYAATKPKFAAVKPSGRGGGALWLKEHAPANQVVFTCDWDDAPELFFYNENNRYLVFLDPSYMYRWKPGLWEEWNQLARNPPDNATAVIAERFGAEYGFCTKHFQRMRGHIDSQSSAEVVYEDDFAFVFRIDRQ